MTGSGNVASDIVAWAVSQEGKPYSWGGTGPDSYDCSGLCEAAYKNGGGVSIPRVAAAQQAAGKTVQASQLGPSDLCFIGTPAYHVVMYAGDGQVIAADNRSYPVRLRAFDPTEFSGGYRQFVDTSGVQSSIISDLTNQIPGYTALDGLYHVFEGVNSVSTHILSATWWKRVGKFGIGIFIIGLALVLINRKQIENAAGKAAKAAAVVAK